MKMFWSEPFICISGCMCRAFLLLEEGPSVLPLFLFSICSLVLIRFPVFTKKNISTEWCCHLPWGRWVQGDMQCWFCVAVQMFTCRSQSGYHQTRALFSTGLLCHLHGLWQTDKSIYHYFLSTVAFFLTLFLKCHNSLMEY